MKTPYIVKYRHGLAGRAMVVASDLDEARREAVAYARYTTTCIPDWYRTDDVVESVEPAGDVPLGSPGYGYRPVSQFETRSLLCGPAKKPEDKEPASGAEAEISGVSDFGYSPVAEAAV